MKKFFDLLGSNSFWFYFYGAFALIFFTFTTTHLTLGSHKMAVVVNAVLTIVYSFFTWRQLKKVWKEEKKS